MSFPAVCTVHTVNGPTHCCAKHAAALKTLMSFMGASTNMTVLEEPQECANCLNEAKGREPIEFTTPQEEFDKIAVALGPVSGPDSPDSFTTDRSGNIIADGEGDTPD